MKKNYRNNGAIGALLDEYEKALDELFVCISSLSNDQLSQVVDPVTKDKDCISVQSILSHVVSSGYNYVVIIKKHKGESIEYYETKNLQSSDDYKTELLKMFEYNVALFDQYPDIKLNGDYFTVRWGINYDVDQIMEHAIVHILRHRRQIERFKLKMNWN